MTERAIESRFQIEPSWRGRALAFLRFVAFAAIFVLANLIMHPALAPIHRHIKSLNGHLLVEMLGLAVITLVLTALMAGFSGRSFYSYGLAGPCKIRNFLIGVVAGITLLAVQLLLENALGYFSFGSAQPFDSSLVMGAILVGAMCLVVGFEEEMLFRGYSLVELSRTISFWPAAILLSVLFGIPHWLKGGGEDFMGGVSSGLFGIAWAYSFRATGSLWLAIGLHAGWNYAESFIFGVPDSALVSPERWLHPVIHGPDWLSGGAVGPEGSVLVLIPLVLLIPVIWLAKPRKDASA